MTSQAHCKGCGHFLSRDDQSINDGHCQKCRLSILSGHKNSNKKMEEKKMSTTKKWVIGIILGLIILTVGIPTLIAGGRFVTNSVIIPVWNWGLGAKATTQNSAAVDTPKTAASNATAPAAPAAPAATSAPAAAPATVNSDEYRWGWDKKETKILLPGYVCAGDVVGEGTKFYDEGGTNEATVVINNSSNGFSVYSEWGAGEFMLSDKGNLIIQIVSDEFATGGDVDAKTVRVVLVTDDGIEQTWYNSRLEIIDQK